MRDAAGTGSPLTAYMREDSLHSAARIGSRLRDACTDSSAELIGRGRFLAFWCVKSMMSVSSMTAPTLKVIGSTRAASLSVPPLHAGAKCGAGQERRGCQTEQLPLEWLGEVKAPTTLASRRPRLFWAVAASAAGTSVAFLNHASEGFMAPRHSGSAHLDTPQLAFALSGHLFGALLLIPIPPSRSSDPRGPKRDGRFWDGDTWTKVSFKHLPPTNTRHSSH